VRQLCLIIVLICTMTTMLWGQEHPRLTLDELNSTAGILVVVYDANRKLLGAGTGVFLYDYDDKSKALLLTAKHVFDGAHYAMPMIIAEAGNPEAFAKSALPLWNENGTPKFLTYKTIDMVLLPVSLRMFRTSKINGLGRSVVTFADSVLNGDQVLMFGAAISPLFRKYEGEKQFLVTSGTVALQTDSTYIIDKRAFHGMSGGVVFKREYGFQQKGNKSHFRTGFTPIGVVTRPVPELGEQYTQVIKIDYVDSILYAHNKVGWRSSEVTDQTNK
jgi:hypothetical protein